MKLRLKEYVEEIPLVDVHTHIDFRSPTARDPEQIMLYHYVTSELRCLNIPVDEIKAKSSDPSGDLMKYFRLIKNTATYWCLKRIISDLYDFHEDPTPENWRALREVIVSRSVDGGWANKIRSKVKLRKIFLTVNPLIEFKPEFDGDFYAASLRLDPLVGGISKKNVESLEKICGCEAPNLRVFSDLLAGRFEAFKGYSVSAALSIQSHEVYKLTHSGLAEEAYSKLYNDKGLSESERVNLRSAALSIVLNLCREYKLPIQLMLGVARDLPGASPPDFAVCFKQRGLHHLCRFFSHYRDVVFHLISAYRFQSHELSAIAKNYPNVYLDGYWWYCFFPESIIQHLLERIQMLPAGKICGFFSDAYVLEWIYGKAALARKVTAEVLESMVERGFYTMEVAKEVAEQILFENPSKLFSV